jgi:hypothetical protein
MLKSTNAIIRVSTAVAALGVLAIGFSQTSSAAPITFAQFHEAGTASDSNLFSYVDVTPPGIATPRGELISSPTFTQTAANGTVGIPVTFTFLNLPSLPADLQGVQNAVLTLTSSTESTVQTLGGGPFLDQSITGTPSSDVLSITLDTPVDGKSNLLTMDFTGSLLGAMLSRTPQLSGDTSFGDTVTYTSDFVTFANATQDYSLTFSSWTTTSSGDGLSVDSTDNIFQSATAAGAGTFDATVVVPEPSTLAVGGLLLFFGRRNKLSKLI